ncbi:MAG: alpha/beta hydrolase [Chloroflexi bacterium]|nr:alpha/beta hydrolase [Chloroflexota bacterium]
MSVVSVNGVDINYREAGEGFPILLIHGYTGNLRNWALAVPAITERYRSISVDLRGHGYSAKPTREEDYSLELMAEDVFGVVQELGVEECHVVGHSMGGMVAQHLVLAHPGLARSLVLMDTSGTPPDIERTQLRAGLGQVLREQGMEGVFDAQLEINPLSRGLPRTPEFLQVWKEQFLLTSPEAYVYCSRAMANRRPLLEELSSLTMPTFVICGEKDELLVEPSRQLHAHIKGSELVFIPGSGHTPQIEKSLDFNRVLMEFLTRVDQVVAAKTGA